MPSGRCWPCRKVELCCSTPHGKQGFFYEAWVHGGPDWHREEVPASAIPRISAAFLAEERAALGFWYGQEYENLFLDTASQLFSSIDIEAAVRDDVAPLWGYHVSVLLPRFRLRQRSDRAP